jgi:hypothetical protein
MSSDIGAVMINFDDALCYSATANFQSTGKVLDNSCSNTDEEESDTTSEDSDQEHNDLFLEEYFHQQFLRMQALYPPTFKSKINIQRQIPTQTTKNLDAPKSSLSVKSFTTTKSRPVSTIPSYSTQQEREKRRNILLQESAQKGSKTANPSPPRISKKIMSYKHDKKGRDAAAAAAATPPTGTMPEIQKLMKRFGGFLRGAAK